MKKVAAKFEIISSDYEEDMTLDLSPEKLAMTLARGKALDVVKKVDDGIVIGIDTFVTFKNHVLGKPKDKKDAEKMLKLLSNKIQKVWSGIAIIDAKTKKELTDYDVSEVKFKQLSEKEIKEYVETGEGLDKAGSYAIQENGDKFVEYYKGSFSNMIGLPVEKLKKNLEKF